MGFKPVSITHTTILVRRSDENDRPLLQVERFVTTLDHCSECTSRCDDCHRLRLISRERRPGRQSMRRAGIGESAGANALKTPH